MANILSKLSVKFNKKLIGITDDYMEHLLKNEWKGNVRELEQMITRQALMEENPVLEGNIFLVNDESLTPPSQFNSKFQKAKKALADAGYNKTKAASILRISRKTLYLWLKQE